MIFLAYIFELKLRSFYLGTTIVLTFTVCYLFSNELVYLLIKPFLKLSLELKHEYLYFIFTSVVDAFLIYLQVSFIIANILIIPFVLIQFWLFVLPGLYTYENITYIILISLSVILGSFGFYIFYWYVLPFMWSFFLNFEFTLIKNPFTLHLEAKLDEYLFLTLKILSFSVICFQFPLVMFLFLYWRFVPFNFFYEKRRYFIVVILIFSAYVSPPDILSQIICSIPLYGFYEISLFLFSLGFFYLKNRVG
jgi:sec-independent protein translocase protein TatC